MDFLDRYFGISDAESDLKTEILAGLTTFLTMAYVVLLAPVTLSKTGMDQGAVFTATCLVSAISCIIMGMYAKLPVALAPGITLMFFFTYTVCGQMKYSWNVALGCVLLSGIIFFILSITKFREWIIDTIPNSLKKAISAGIGAFILFIALQGSGIIVNDPDTLVRLGSLNQYKPIMTLFCFILIILLAHYKVVGSVLISMIIVTVFSVLTGHAIDIFSMGEGTVKNIDLISLPPSISPIFMAFDWQAVLNLSLLTVVFAFLFVDLFDTAGTLISVTDRAGLVVDNKIPRLKQALIADSSSTVISSFFGVSSSTSYVESAAGVAAGGRTGLTAVVTGLAFLCILFFEPLARLVPQEAVSGALLYVAVLMMAPLSDIEWNDVSEAAPAMLTVFGITLSYSIADGIALGFISYALIKLCTGKQDEVSLGVWLISGLLIGRMILMIMNFQ